MSKLDRLITKHYGIANMNDQRFADSLISALKEEIKKELKADSYIAISVCNIIDRNYANLKGESEDLPPTEMKEYKEAER